MCSMDKNEMFSDEFTDKINYIKSVDEESCKFLYNLYVQYYLSEKSNDVNEYILKNKCMFQADIKDIVEQCKKDNKTIIEITNIYDDRYKRLKTLCMNMGVNILTIESIKKIKSLKRLLGNNSNGVFLDININAIEEWYNWDVILENNITRMFNNFDKVSLKELKKNPSVKVKEIVLISLKENRKKEDNRKLKLMPLIRKMDDLLKIEETKEGELIANIYSHSEININYIKELSEVIQLLMYSSKSERYEYVYDLLCEKLEIDINKYNYCLFENDKCIAQRENEKWPENKFDGCCFNISKKEKCEHLNDKSCNIKCISCRLFTCKYLKNTGIDYDVRKNILVKYCMNPLQKSELIWNFFTPKERILKNIYRYKIGK